MSSILRRSFGWQLAVLFAVMLMVVGACGGDDSGAAATTVGAVTAGGDEAPAPGDGGNAESAGDGDSADRGALDDGALGSGGAQPIAQPGDFGRDIIYTADLTVAVTDVVTAGEEASLIISGFGGVLFGQQTQGLPEPRSVLVFKVLPDNFQAALSALGSIGEVRTQNVSADDVTERVVDLQSRISTAETSVERLRGFLENATTISDIAELEAQLVIRETDLETMRGQLRTLQDRVDLATITLTLTEALADPEVRLVATAYFGDDGGASCPGSEGLTVEEGQQANLCFEIRNNGDTVLTDFTLVDTVLELTIDDLTVIDGDPSGSLQPGQSMILTKLVDVERRIRTQTTVTAVPVNEDGTPIETRVVSSTGTVSLRAEKPEGMPGFDDGMRVATDVLSWIGGVIVIAAGLAVPFLWVIPLAAIVWWWWRRRKDGRDAEPAAAVGDAAEEPVPAGSAAAHTPVGAPSQDD
ncbi:MAG: DUF4349 domain-containing protein [Acidimicrobiia bacterium]|nr:DUF4349 domain-containing protein [Acidimicrobiia bacterium]